MNLRFVLPVFCVVVAACGNRLTSGSTNRIVVPPPPPLPVDHASVGLVSVAGAEGRLRVDWQRGSAAIENLEFALFVSTNRALVLAATPIPIDIRAGSHVVENLSVGVEVFAQLGVRAHALDRFEGSGPVLTAHTARPLFVDPSVPIGSGDGLTPETPTSDLVLALVTAFVEGGGNVYLSAGDIVNASFPLYTGVQLVGGFGPDFALETRDPAVHRTRFFGASAQTMFRVETGALGTAALDGVELTGTFDVPTAIDIPQKPCEIRGVTVSGTSRGFKVRGLPTGPVFDVTIAGSSVAGCEIEGLSVDAAVNMIIERSTFDSNGNEGADFNHIWAPSGESVQLVARACVFTRNGTEGLDVHLGSPGGAAGGRFVIDVTDCDFEVNALDGARFDVDYEAAPQWSSTIEVSGSRARANGAAGLHFDLDSTSTALAHRVSCSGNSGDGVLVTSETATGTASLSCSATFANLGFGARLAFGNFGLLASNCVFAGNALGGIDSPIVRSSVHSSVFQLQPNATFGCDVLACATVGFNESTPFLRAPREYATITTAAGATLGLAAPTLSGTTFPFEISDDGTLRTVTSLFGSTLSIEPSPPQLRIPARGAFFDHGDTTQEDWRLSDTSIAHGIGLAAVGAPPVDAGVFGAQLVGVPGASDTLRRPLFRVASTEPSWTSAISPSTHVRLVFEDGIPLPTSVSASIYGVSANGNVLGTIAFVDGEQVVVMPPAVGWQLGDRIEVHAALRSTLDVPLAFAAAIPLRIQ